MPQVKGGFRKLKRLVNTEESVLKRSQDGNALLFNRFLNHSYSIEII